MKRLFLSSGTLLFLLSLAGCAKSNLKESLTSMQAPSGGPMLLAIY